MKKILLMGQANVGKSALFNRLAGAGVFESNYPGTTVDFFKGRMRVDGEWAELIDVPGTFSLEPKDKAEKVSVEMLEQEKDATVVCTIDSSKVERGLYLVLKIIERGYPVIVVLNMWDVARNGNIQIDTKKLEQILGVPVVTTVATRGEGLGELVKRMKEARPTNIENILNRVGLKLERALTVDETWDLVERVARETLKVGIYQPTLKDMLSELTVKPWPGILLAIGVLYGFWAIFGAWFSFFTEPYMSFLFNNNILVWLQSIFPGGGATLEESSFLYVIFVGDPEATICFEAFGVLTGGLFVAIGIVLPAVLMFYLLLGILEDCGYLPRLAVLVDTIFHKIGLHGFTVVPLLLSLGCNIPGVVACRTMETKKERFMAMTLMGVFIPCAAQLAVMMSIVPEYLGFILAFLIISFLIAGVFLNRIIPGKSAELLIDVPPYQMPTGRNIGMKLRVRVESFLYVAVPFVLGAVVFVNILYWFGVMDYIASALEPVFTGWFGVPKETTGPLIVAFLRKDLAIAHLGGITMTMGQKIISVTLICIYFPCLATFAMVLKEGGIIDLLKCIAVLLISFFLFGGLMNGIVNLMGI